MTIDEACDKIKQPQEPKENKKVEEKQPEVCSDDVSGVIKSCMTAEIQLINKLRDKTMSISMLDDFIEYVRFGAGCYARLRPVPRQKILSVLEKKNPQLHELLQISNLVDCIPDPMILQDHDSYKDIPAWTQIKAGLNHYDLNYFHNHTTDFMVIPDLMALSLFMNTGADLRKYCSITTPKKTEDLLYYSNTSFRGSKTEKCAIKFTQIDPFSTESVLKYCKEAKPKNVKEMINETQNLLMQMASQTSDDTQADKINKIRNELYEKLKRANPDLCTE